MKLLQYVIIFVVIFYGLRLLFRLLLPFLVQYLFKKTHKNMREQFRTHEEKEEGEVTIRDGANKKRDNKNDKGDAGEYVDFEEVE
ncbi:MAG TPA: DUF4834 domain-containing protein [Flavobacteriales bacterium]|nr:DUF4834 domain-containing protein [Flavobacteriales bacterium]